MLERSCECASRDDCRGGPASQGKRGERGTVSRETAAEKGMFRQALQERRCIIPASGFYEWRHEGNKKYKDKYIFRRAESPMLYMAGLYSVYKKEGVTIPAFVILTTDANRWVQPVHDRMPVILDGDEQEMWLKDEIFARHVLEREGPPLEMIRQ